MRINKNFQPIARLRSGDQEYLLYPGTTLKIGRSNENDIVLNDPKVSRVHAELVCQESAFALSDMGSINGTFVNGERLVENSRLLRDGDHISISKQHLIFEMVRIEQTETLHEPFKVDPDAQNLTNAGAYLVVQAGPDTGQQYPLWGEVITIGRASREATWEIRLTDRSVSRPHARLERGAETVQLVDLESVNGTLLNGVQVTDPVPVQDGDVISVGETQLVYHAG